MAHRVSKLIEKSVAASADIDVTNERPPVKVEQMLFPGLSQPVTSAAWCAEHELCCTLEDYLRRRTNIAQWVHRGGLGIDNSNAPILKKIARDLAQGDPVLADRLFDDYGATIKNNFDSLILNH
jgi:hypothetical protein